MKKQTTFKWRYGIFLAPFPFSDLKTNKYRPVLCLTEPQGKHEEITLAYITSNLEGNAIESDVLVKKTDSDFKSSGLKANSSIKLNKLLTLPKERVAGQLGRISDKKTKEIKLKLRKLFSL